MFIFTKTLPARAGANTAPIAITDVLSVGKAEWKLPLQPALLGRSAPLPAGVSSLVVERVHRQQQAEHHKKQAIK
jgi:hypothetical protein